MLFRKKDDISRLKELIADFKRTASHDSMNQMLELFPRVPLYYESWKVELGPDGFPYLDVGFKGRNENRTTLKEIAPTALTEGFGVTLNKVANKVDWVFSLGDFIPLARAGIMVTHNGHVGLQSKRVEEKTEVQIGLPNEDIIPMDVRKHLRKYLQTAWKVENPKFYLMLNPKDNPPWTIMFNFSRRDFENETEYRNALSHLSWFFPKTVFVGCIKDDSNEFFEI